MLFDRKMSGVEQSIISRFVARKRSLSVSSFVNLAHGLGHSFERQMAEISAIASVRESDEHSCQPLSRRHPLAGMHAIETAIVNAVAASRDALAATHGTRLPDPDRSPDCLWSFHLHALAYWRFSASLLDASIVYMEFFKRSSGSLEAIRSVAAKSESKCDGYVSFFDAAFARVVAMRDLMKKLIEESEDRETFDYNLIWQGGNVVLEAFRTWELSHTVSDYDLIEGLRWELSNLNLLEKNFRGLLR